MASDGFVNDINSYFNEFEQSEVKFFFHKLYIYCLFFKKSHNEYLIVYRDMKKKQENCKKALKHLNYCYKQFENDLKK